METITEILVHPGLWVVIGIAARAFCPAVIPFLGSANKVVEELVSMHDQRSTSNSRIILDAENKGLKEAAKLLNKKLTVKTLADES